MASGHVNRVKRPDTWLHRPMLQNVKKVLANPEPSTHDPKRTSAGPERTVPEPISVSGRTCSRLVFKPRFDHIEPFEINSP